MGLKRVKWAIDHLCSSFKRSAKLIKSAFEALCPCSLSLPRLRVHPCLNCLQIGLRAIAVHRVWFHQLIQPLDHFGYRGNAILDHSLECVVEQREYGAQAGMDSLFENLGHIVTLVGTAAFFVL